MSAESTEKKAVWCVAHGKDWKGPYTAEQLLEKVREGEVADTAYVWRPGMPAWQRLAEIEELQALLTPSKPASGVVPPPFPSAKAKPSFPAYPAFLAFGTRRDWLVSIGQKQYGPFSVLEIRGYLEAGRIDSRAFAWKQGMPGWERIDQIPELKPATNRPSAPDSAQSAPSTTAEAPPSAASQAENMRRSRVAQRRPIAARILLTDDATVCEATSKDISTGGMSVLADSVPGEVGARIRLNISPSGHEGGKLRPFVAEGRIVRKLAGGRGFSFRFEKLSDHARDAIEAFAENSR